MTITKYTAELVKSVLLSPIVRHLTLSLIDPREINFTAGQYGTFIINPSTRRSYSFCSNPHNKNLVELCVDNLPGGTGSKWWSGLKLSDRVEFLAPLGKFAVDTQSAKNKIFIATGTGIAPVRSMILDLLENNKTTAKVILLFGVRNEDNKLFFDQFTRLSQDYPNFNFRSVISQAGDAWQGKRGRANDLLYEIDKTFLIKAEFYLCGSCNMIAGVKEQLIKIGVNEENIHFEQFY